MTICVLSDVSAPASAEDEYTTACSPKRMSFPGADATARIHAKCTYVPITKPRSAACAWRTGPGDRSARTAMSMQRKVTGSPDAAGGDGAASTRSVGELLSACESSSDDDGLALEDEGIGAPDSWFNAEGPEIPSAGYDAAGRPHCAASRWLT